MNFNKNNILILKNRLFLIKSVFVIIFLSSCNLLSTQHNKALKDSKEVIADNEKEVINYNKSDSIENVILINDSIIVNDTIPMNLINIDSVQTKSIPADSISLDSIKLISISSDAIDQVIDYNSSDSILFSLTDEMMFLYGIGDLSSQDMNLKSAYVEINTDENYLFSNTVEDSSVITKPQLTQGDETFTVKSIKYNFKSKKALVIDAKMKQEQGYMHADTGKMQSNKEFHIKNGKFTTCDLDHPHFYIKLTKAKKIPDKHIISGPMYFVIADIPLYPIGLPFGLLPNQKHNSSGLIIPEYGEDANRGFYLRNGGYFWAINDKINASLTGEAYSKGSWGLTLNSDFKQRYKYSGKFNMVYSVHRTEEKEISDNVKKTFWVKGSYMQDSKANPNSNFSTSLDFGMSGHNDLNAKNIEEFADNQKSSNISYMWSKPGSIINFSAKIGFNQNTKTHQASVNLPTFSLNIKKQFPFKSFGTGSSKWYQKIGYSVNINAKNTVTTTDTMLFTQQTLYQMQNGLQYSIPVGTSFKILDFINVAPSFSYTGRLYGKYLIERNILQINNEGNIVEGTVNDTINKINHPYNFNFSIPFSTKLYGIFKINKGRVKAIRHVVSPSLSFSYKPDFSNEIWGFYGYNSEDSITPYYSHTQGFIYGTPPTGKSGAIGLNIGNNFEMKLKSKNDTIDEAEKIKLLDNLSISTSYNLAVDSLNLSNIRITGNTKLFSNFSARFGAVFDPYIVDTDSGSVTLGQNINAFEFIENKKIARFNSANFSISGSLKPNKSGEPTSAGAGQLIGNNFYYYTNPDIPYTDVTIPWNLSINYDLTVKNKFDKVTRNFIPETTQTASINGSLSLTENWKITASSRYDFSAKKFISANLSVYRDLHCWEMSFNVIPFGTWKSYTFRINIKSSVLKDLKYEKRKEIDRSSVYGN